MKKAVFGLAIIPVILIIFLIAPEPTYDHLLMEMEQVVTDAVYYNEDPEQALAKWMAKPRYQDACRSLYQDYQATILLVKQGKIDPNAGPPPERVMQFLELRCEITIADWNK